MEGPTGKVLVVEDAEDVRSAIALVLRRSGLEPVEAEDGRSALRMMYEVRPDCVILDIALPELDGWQVLGRLRDLSDVPVLMLTARHRETDKVRGLQEGADDYMTKPFSNAELVARVHALLRRSRTTTPGIRADLFSDGSLIVDEAGHRVLVDDTAVELTPTEFRLLLALTEHHMQVLSPQQLLHHAWRDPTGTSPDRVKFVVYRLRQKLRDAGMATDVIEAVRGVGYRYKPQ